MGTHSEGPQKLAFTIPIYEPLPPQYYVRLVSDSWLQVRGALKPLLSILNAVILSQAGGSKCCRVTDSWLQVWAGLSW